MTEMSVKNTICIRDKRKRTDKIGRKDGKINEMASNDEFLK